MKFERISEGTPVPAIGVRARRGAVACAAGRFAEESVAREYRRRGYEVLAERWRGRGGEIDLILRKDEEYAFVEVKKSHCHDRAAERISRRQIARICQAALEYCGRLPAGLLTAMRFDAALVDQLGRVEIIENAFGMN
ncbi:YraN family protein [Paracoccus sp. PS-1]|uniref:YraN family protein n=1 Tax=unclassified Paracoccus (in: a-proteobacteria) TaxID=2688777 RepID=UPI0004AEF765|nr:MULTISPECIES: YraN family protein [unclassified Paracoccus (in: a-proteobacteria)]MDQ7261169.1 YraN family protein [Paracoccus sp. PS1]